MRGEVPNRRSKNWGDEWCLLGLFRRCSLGRWINEWGGMSYHVSFQLISLLWRSFSVPKHSTTLWLCSTGFLQKIDKLKGGRIIKPIYILCNQSNGSRHHLDFACPYARQIWIIFYKSAKSTGLYWRVAAGIQLSKKDFQNKPFFQLVKHCLVCLSLFYLEGKTRSHEGKCSSEYSVWFYSFCCKCRLPGTPISNFAITRSLFVVIMTYFRSSLDWFWYYIF